MATEAPFGRLVSWAETAWRTLESLLGLASSTASDADRDLHATVTYRAVVDAVIPETPALANELGPEHGPGGIAVDLEEFIVVYVNDLAQFGLPHIGARGNLHLAAPVANVLDAAALTLVERGENESEPTGDRPVSLLEAEDRPPSEVAGAAGTFAELSRRDRLRALTILDEFEFEVAPFGRGLFEFDAGIVGQLVVGFTEMIYYSEWQGYDEFTQSPSDRIHQNDPTTVQSWRQTGYPGFANGYAALRGYVGREDSPLGDGDTWTSLDGDAGVRVTRTSGSFRENDYDTSGYEEPYPEGAT